MPVIKSAKKAHKGSIKKRVFNDRRRKNMKEAVKAVKDLVAEKKKDEAVKLMPTAYKAIDKAAKRGVIKDNTASRKKSRLMASIKKLG